MQKFVVVFCGGYVPLCEKSFGGRGVNYIVNASELSHVSPGHGAGAVRITRKFYQPVTQERVYIVWI